MRLTGIAVYPVKSLRGMALESAVVEPWGLADDRRWAVVDERGGPVTCRTSAAMLGVTAVPANGTGLLLSAPGVESLAVTPTTERVPVGFSRLDTAMLADPGAHEWLSTVLGRRVRLVWLDDPRRRTVSLKHGGRGDDPLSLADAGPLLLASTASLRQVEAWSAEEAARAGGPPPAPLDMRRFRPNVIVDGESPFAEDGWAGVRIGDVPFRVAERCDRCVVTLIDPETVIRGKEPIRTLARYRRWHGRVWFGVRLVPGAAGVLRVGDPVVAHGSTDR